ncbi:hypothetical protein FHT13_002212 [Xanthomonas arboricola]|nr:hypothetical protein [Xanthomonas arboricola]
MPKPLMMSRPAGLLVKLPKQVPEYPHRWFGPILGLYPGARINPIAQLRLEDIETIGGVPGFFVRQGAKGQSVNHESGRRFTASAPAG